MGKLSDGNKPSTRGRQAIYPLAKAPHVSEMSRDTGSVKRSTSIPTPVNERQRCKALTMNGNPCQLYPVKGLAVCRFHGGGTTTSIRKARKTRAVGKLQAVGLWGHATPDVAEELSVLKELTQLAQRKQTDIMALRIKLGADPEQYYGLLVTEQVSTSSNTDEVDREVKRLSVHPLVEELHRAEREYLLILRAIQEFTAGYVSDDERSREYAQIARHTARLMKAYPGLSAEDVARQVSRGELS